MIAKLIRIERLATGTFHALWRSSAKINFVAGQYLRYQLIKPAVTDSQGDSREFSIVSSPNNPNEIEMAWRDSPSAFKRSLLEMKLGQKVEIKGPYGHFTLPKNDQPLALLAGGIGITPLLSISRFLAEIKDRRSVILLSANSRRDTPRKAHRQAVRYSSPDKVPFTKELLELKKENHNFKTIEHIGPLTSKDVLTKIPDIAKRICMIAGPPQLVFDLRESLRTAGVPETNILYEDFIGYE